MILTVQELDVADAYKVEVPNKRSGRRVFQVSTDEPVGPLAVIQATGVPSLADFWSYRGDRDTGCRCRSISPRLVDPRKDRLYWHVTCEYSSEVQDGAAAEDPLDRPPKFGFSINKPTKFVTRYPYGENEGKPIVNTAGYPVAGGVEVEDLRAAITITRNEALFNLGQAIQFNGATNSAYWQGVEPGKAKIVDIQPSQVIEGDNIFWEVTYAFEFSDDGFDIELDSVGFVSKSNDRRDEAWPLNSSGEFVPQGDSSATATITIPIKAKDFNELALPAI